MHDIVTNLFTPFLLSLLVALGIGLIVGMEREFDILSGNEHFAGLRAFVITSLLGCITSFLSLEFNAFILLVISPALIVFFGIFHYSKIQKGKIGIVTELSLVMVFFLGVLSGLHYMKEALAVAVIVTAVLALKNKFRETIGRITQYELFAFVKFIILALLLLPFLPDKDYGPGALINPQSIGFVIVIVSSLSFIGYFVVKFFGTKKGILFTAFFGGLVSSTAVTWVFSKRSKENEGLSMQYATGIIIACTVMFVRVLAVAALFNTAVLTLLLLPFCLIIASASLAAYVINRKGIFHAASAPVQLGNPLDVGNALLFGAWYTGVTFLVYYANNYLGTKGLFITGFISGLADVDAISISISRLSIIQINPSVAAIVILLAVLSNTIFKMAESYIRGSVKLRRQVLIGLLPSLIIALLSIIFIYLNIEQPVNAG